MNFLARSKPATLEVVLRDLQSRDVRARVAAVEHAPSVARAENARGGIVDALVRALKDDSEHVRGAAALALADMEANEALPALLVAADDDAFVVRQLAITALGEIGDRRALERVRRALRDPRPEVRFQAVVAFPRLAREDDGNIAKEVWNALSAGLEDDDPFVRSRAAEACAEVADGAPLTGTISDRLARLAADKSESPDTRVAAAIALGESGDARGEKVLLAVMRGDIDEPDPRRVQAIFELAGELKLEAARPLATAAAFGLRARFGDPSRRAAALVTLIRLGDRRAIDQVIGDLNGRSYERRTLAIGIAARAAMTEAAPHLEALKRDASLADPDAIDDALTAIRVGGPPARENA